MTQDEDTSLLLSWHRGDLSAFETLIWKYQKRVFNIVLLLSGEQQVACSVTENAFVEAFQNIKAMKSTVRFSSWLVAIVLKICRELEDYRSDGSHPSLESEPDTDLDSSYAAALQKKLELCIRELPFELGELILLRYVRGYSLERIEEILQINGELLRSRLFEAQETLACWLKSDTENPAELASIKIQANQLHADIRRNFSAYLDSSVEGEEKELTKLHLKSCGSCREALAELEWMVEDIKSIPDVEPPGWIAPSIMQRVKSYPAKPVAIGPPSQLKIRLAVAALSIVVIGSAAFLMMKGSETRTGGERSAGPPTAAPTAEQKPSDFTALFKGIFRGDVPSTGIPAKRENLPATALPPPVPTPAPAQVQTPAVMPPVQPTPPARFEAVPKKEKPEMSPPLPQEWGDAPPQNRVPQKKAPAPRPRGGEIAVVLTTADPVAAANDIENAVSAVGGRVNGRAYSGGADIIYTRVDVNSFFDLISRLGKIGRIQELPQLPEEAEGDLELIIRW